MFFLQGGPLTRVYGVLGLVCGIHEVLGPVLPVYTKAVLLPFAGRIIYDGLLQTSRVSFGSGIRRGLEDDYREARKNPRDHHGSSCTWPAGGSAAAPAEELIRDFDEEALLHFIRDA